MSSEPLDPLPEKTVDAPGAYGAEQIAAARQNLIKKVFARGAERRHELKSWPENFHRLICGDTLTDVRIDDRDIQRGDRIVFQEFVPDHGIYSGKEAHFEALDVIRNCAGILPGYCVLCLRTFISECQRFNKTLLEKNVNAGRETNAGTSDGGSAPSGAGATEKRVNDDPGVRKADS